MRALVVFCHPRTDSFTAAVRDVVVARLDAAGADIRVSDLYRRNFSPVLSAHELDIYLDTPANQAPVAQDVEDLKWCDTLIFIYPTWWYGLPAMLKGWLDRVLLPGVAFLMPDAAHADIRPGLGHITRLAVFTTGGASRSLTRFIGAPGRRTLLRGLRILCARRCVTAFSKHYLMDSSTEASRRAHLDRVARMTDRLIAGRVGWWWRVVA